MKITLFHGTVCFTGNTSEEKRAQPRFSLDFPPGTDTDEHDEERMAVLQQIANHYGISETNNRELTVTVRCKNSCPCIPGEIQLYDVTSFLRDVSVLFGQDNVHVKITISGLTCSTSRSTFGGGQNSSVSYEGKICSKEMTVMDRGYVTCEDNSIQFPSQEWRNKFYGQMGQNYVTAYSHVTIDLTIDTSRLTIKGSNPMTTQLYRKMLHDEIHCDAEIIGSTGNPVKCHKAVLSACSTVLTTMFQAPMVEASAHKVEIKDMTEEGVKAFLAFVYYLCKEEPNKDGGIAYELLNAGHKYNVVPDLEGAMIKLLLGKEADWFDVNVAVHIFSLARNIPSGEELKMKCVGVLKKKLCQLADSESYNLLFQKDQSAAKELCKLAFVTSS